MSETCTVCWSSATYTEYNERNGRVRRTHYCDLHKPAQDNGN